MDVQLEQTGAFGRKLSITIPVDAVEKAFDEVSREYAKQARIPGFRPGKIPRGVLEQHYGPQIKSEVRERLVGDTLVSALQDKSLAPVNAPHLHVGALDRGASFSYTAEFEVRPSVELKTYRGLKIDPIKVEVSDAEVDAQLEILRKQSAQLVPVLIRDTVEEGDAVLIDYEGTMGGIPFEGGKAENALIEVGGEGYLPQLSQGLLGARVPGERHIQVDFPADYQVKALAGKPATFRVSLKEIKKKELPSLDDEFARDVGEESLVALRVRVTKSLEVQKRRDAEGEQRKQLLEALVAANPFELPPSMVEQQAERMIENAQAHVTQMVGQHIQLSADEQRSLRDKSKPSAEMQVRSGLLLLEVAKAEKLTVDDGEIDAEIDEMIKALGNEAPRLLSHYRDPENRERLRYRLLEEKVVKFLLAHADGGVAPPTLLSEPQP
jgi:trigger factor